MHGVLLKVGPVHLGVCGATCVVGHEILAARQVFIDRKSEHFCGTCMCVRFDNERVGAVTCCRSYNPDLVCEWGVGWNRDSEVQK